MDNIIQGYTKKRIMLGTLGLSWAIVPELLGFCNPDSVPIFNNRKDIQVISNQLGKIDEFWLVASNIKKKNINLLLSWQEKLNLNNIKFKIWVAENIDDLTDEEKILAMRELIWRISLKAFMLVGYKNISYCLAGGRKTMSADLQEASNFFGYDKLIHVIDTGFLPPELRNDLKPDYLTKPLSEKESYLFLPIIMSSNVHPSELIEQDSNLFDEKFGLPDKTDELDYISVKICETNLIDYIKSIKSKAENIFINHAISLSNNSHNSPFHALYALPRRITESLKSSYIGFDYSKKEQELSWLRSLPKTDLHCHLGGIADATDLLEIANSVALDIEKYEEKISDWLKVFRLFIKNNDLIGLKKELLSGNLRIKDALNKQADYYKIPVWIICASFILLFKDNPQMLDEFIYEDCINSDSYICVGIDKYETFGDFQGSSLLQTEKTIRTACKLLVKKCIEQNIRYIEVRCSPINYTKCGLKDIDVLNFICSEMKKGEPFLNFGIILIASRHGKMSNCWRHVELAQEVWDSDFKYKNYLIGFDLAGNEKFDALNFIPVFKPLFENCFHITVHAGETESVESIWKAVYFLNAERIGHGLSLIHKPELMSRFLDRRISIEMCPSSNLQIVGYKHSFMDRTNDLQNYPLSEYLRMGIKVSINTDDPGISRTNITEEYYKASCMTPGGLSKWDVLQIIKNGFTSSFASHDLKRKVLQDAEKYILDNLIQK